MNRPVDRFRLIVQIENLKMPWLEEKTGINRKRWTNVKMEGSEMRATEIEALCKLYPEYTIWLATGQEQPEIGQISPMTKRSQRANG